MNTKTISITLPPAHHAALSALAAKRGVSLSELLRDSATEKLTARERAKLPTPKRRGRPKGT